jgi:hypothetical protein
VTSVVESKGRAGATVRRVGAAVALAGALGACGGGSSGSGAPSGEAAAAALAPVPAPADLALECVLPVPDATWSKTRAEVGGAAAFLPTTAGGLVAVSLRFPLALSESIDGRVPAVCAATLAKDGSDAHAVIGVHLRWPDRLVDGLTKGSEARFTARNDPATHIDVLEPRDAKDASYATGVLGNYLLIASRAEDLAALGPYVARTMPGHAKDFPTGGVRIAGVAEQPPLDLVARLLPAASGAVAAMGGRAWSLLGERALSKLPVPFPFGDDAAAALAVLPDVDGAELRVTIGDHATVVEATAPLRKGSAGDKAARALGVGDAAPLLSLPKDTLAAALFRRTTPAGAGAGASAAASATGNPSAAASAAPAGSAAPGGGAGPSASAVARALGIGDTKDAAKVEALVRALDDARGDWWTAGFTFDSTGPSAFARGAVRNGAELDGALKDFLALADGARPTEPVHGQKLRVTTGKTVLENIPGDVFRLRLSRGGDAAKKGAEPPSEPTATPGAVDLLFRRSDDVFVAATGYASRDALRALLVAPSGENLAKVPEVAGPLAHLGSGLSLGAFFDPGRIAASRAGKPGSVTAAPVVIGLGREAGETATLVARLEAANSAVGELVRWLSQ